MSFNSWLHKILPVSRKDFKKQINSLENTIQVETENVRNLQYEMRNLIIKQIENNQSSYEILHREVQHELKSLRDEIAYVNNGTLKIHDHIEQQRADSLCRHEERQTQVEFVQRQIGEMQEGIKRIQQSFAELRVQYDNLTTEIDKTHTMAVEAGRYAAESVWGEIFNQTIQGSAWLKDISFSPGRWAIGYQYLYVLYRILNEVQPQNILELGLGQSTKMISQYVNAFDHIEHRVVEHDSDWISFFENSFTIPESTNIIQLPWDYIEYKGVDHVRVFQGFKEAFQSEKFDFISIDAPLGGDMKEFARIDVLQLIPDILAPNFIIMIDDCNRPGEQRTVTEMENMLRACQIDYSKGRYSGHKDCVILASQQMKFVCSM